jgi:DNA repair protein RecN (Recombination protein N)
MLRRLSLRDFVIVAGLEVDFDAGFTVLTGETGAGKSILIDALQLALGSRADAAVVREGAARADITAEFDPPPTLHAWLEEAGIEMAESLLLRRVVDAQGKSRAWINGTAVTVTQLRQAADHLVEIHGQHAWQSLTRPAAVRALFDSQAGIDTAPLSQAWQAWQAAVLALQQAREQSEQLSEERERLQWQVGELEKLAPAAQEWESLNSEHTRLAHAQTLLDAAQSAFQALSDDELAADTLTGRALDALDEAVSLDPQLADVAEVLRSAQAQLQDAAHSLKSYLNHHDPNPERLTELDARLSTWMALARRFRRPPAELAALLESWKSQLQALEASADLDSLEATAEQAKQAWQAQANQVSAQRRKAAPVLGASITQAMQQLGMAGGQFEVALMPVQEPQSYGLESVEFLVAGHAGSSPRPLARVASGGELSRLALAIAVTTARSRPQSVASLIFDEIDSGVGGTVADTVGRLMKELGTTTQVFAVTHLAQVAACADSHFVVAKHLRDGITTSDITPVTGEARVAEIARMLGGERLSGQAHAQTLLGERQSASPAKRQAPRRSSSSERSS